MSWNPFKWDYPLPAAIILYLIVSLLIGASAVTSVLVHCVPDAAGMPTPTGWAVGPAAMALLTVLVWFFVPMETGDGRTGLKWAAIFNVCGWVVSGFELMLKGLPSITLLYIGGGCVGVAMAWALVAGFIETRRNTVEQVKGKFL